MISEKDLPDGPGAKPLNTGKRDPFFWAAIKHDFDYLQGGTIDSMIKADHTFYKNCLGVMKRSWNPLVWLRGSAYISIVSLAARFFWQNKDRLHYGINYDEYIGKLK